MKVGTRLYLAVIPAVLGVLVVAALAYWGEYGRQAPEAVVIVAVIASVGSLIIAWNNTRYVAMRVEQLAQRRNHRLDAALGASLPVADELDVIEKSVAGLQQQLDAARAEGDARERLAAKHSADMVAQIDEAMDRVQSRLLEAQLPVHILLESPFGSLNENQEEMLSAAQQSLADAAIQLRHARELTRDSASAALEEPRASEQPGSR